MRTKFDKLILENDLSYDLQTKLANIENKPDANAPITPATKTKITYDSKGLVTEGTDLIASDIPTLTLSKISDAGTVANKDTGTDAGEIPILDAQGKLLIDVIPSSVTGGKTFIGVWDASGGTYPATPTLSVGDFWTISVAGIIDAVTFNRNDELIYNGSGFDHIDNSELVTFAQDVARVGFVNNTDTETPYLSGAQNDIVNLDDSGAGWSYYYGGVKYTISGNKTVALTGGAGNAHANGIHWVYINNTTGTLATSTTVPDLTVDVVVAYVFWNQTLASGIIADERHTIKWDSNTHRHFHLNYGAKLRSGANISGYTLDSVTDAHKQYSITSGILEDEDLVISATPLVGGNGQYTNLYRTASGVWGWEQNKDFPFRYATSGRMIYDSATPTGTECTSGKYINTYAMISNLGGQARYHTITSQTQYNTLNAALTENYTDLTLTGLDVPEYVVLNQLTWFTDDSLSGTGKCKLVDVHTIRKNYKELYNISITRTCDIDDCEDRRYVTDANLVVINNTSNTNTGDETQSTIKTKLGAATALADGYLAKEDFATFNGKQAALGYTAENVANKTTSWQVTPNNTKYPTEKLVKDSLDAKADVITYGSLYEDSAVPSTLTLTTAGTYYKWASSVAGLSSGIIVSATNNNITIGSNGVYRVSILASVASDKANNNLRVSLFKNNSRVNTVSALQRNGTANAAASMSCEDIISLNTSDVIDVRFTAGVNNTALSIYNVNFVVMKIG